MNGTLESFCDQFQLYVYVSDYMHDDETDAGSGIDYDNSHLITRSPRPDEAIVVNDEVTGFRFSCSNGSELLFDLNDPSTWNGKLVSHPGHRSDDSAIYLLRRKDTLDTTGIRFDACYGHQVPSEQGDGQFCSYYRFFDDGTMSAVSETLPDMNAARVRKSLSGACIDLRGHWEKTDAGRWSAEVTIDEFETQLLDFTFTETGDLYVLTQGFEGTSTAYHCITKELCPDDWA